MVLLCSGLPGCVNVPGEVVELHEKQKAIAEELKRTHLALVDGYVDQRLAKFHVFYFSTYGPRYLVNWKSGFKVKFERDYDEAKDFPQLHQDLLAGYFILIEPIELMRTDLKAAIDESYTQFSRSHDEVHSWLLSAKRLSDTERALLNKFLAKVNPTLSLNAIDEKVDEIQAKLEKET